MAVEQHARRFSILGTGESIAWSAIAPQAKQAERNHGQSLERLALRGGLDWVETWLVLTGQRFWEAPSMTAADARAKVLAICEKAERETGGGAP